MLRKIEELTAGLTPKAAEPVQKQSVPVASATADTIKKPGNAYNSSPCIRERVAELLKKHNFTEVSKSDEKSQWRRPGKDSGSSLTLYTDGTVHCFSSNAKPFEANENYSPFAVLALFEHGGDFKAATKQLASEGYGKCNGKPKGVDTETPAERREWQPPVDFHDHKLPAFPTRELPQWLAEYVEMEAESTQTPADLAGSLALAVLATALQKKFYVRARRDWTEPLNIYTCSAMDPAHRKSAVFGHLTAPLEEYERRETKLLEPQILEINIKREVLEKRIAVLMKDAAKKANAIERDRVQKEIIELTDKLVLLVPPRRPRLIVADCTPEKAGNLLSEQLGKLAVMDPEGGIFEIMAGRYNESGANIELYLKAHAGDTLRVDRLGRASEFVSFPALTIGLTVQPAVIAGMGLKPGFRSKGLSARFLYSLPVSRLGYRNINPAPMPPHVSTRYRENILSLLGFPHPVNVDTRELLAHEMTFDPNAAETLNEFMAATELKLRSGGELANMTDWGGKLVGATVRISALLHLADKVQCFANSANTAKPVQISDEVLRISQRALIHSINLSLYFTEHAKAAFALMGADPAVSDAKKLLKWILGHSSTVFTKRDIFEAVKGTFKSAAALEPGLELLEQHGFIREIARQPGKAGRPSHKYEINPYSQNSQYSQKTEDAA